MKISDLEKLFEYSYKEMKTCRLKTQETLLNWIDIWVPEEEKKTQILAVKIAMEPYSKEEYRKKLKEELAIKLPL